MNGTNRQAENDKKQEATGPTPTRRESAKKFCAAWMGTTIGFAFMMSSIDVHRAVGVSVLGLTRILSNSEADAKKGMGRFLLALVGAMLLALAGVYGGTDLATMYPLLQNLLVAGLTICWIVCLILDYRRWRKQSDSVPGENAPSACDTMQLAEQGKKQRAEA